MIISTIGGLLLIVAGLALIGRSTLLSHKTYAWPNTTRWVTWALRLAGWTLIPYGLVVATGRDVVSPGTVGVFFVVCLYNVAQLITLLGKRKISYVHLVHSH